MKAVRQQVPTPPVEIIEEVVLTMSVEEAKKLHERMDATDPKSTAWRTKNGIDGNEIVYQTLAAFDKVFCK